MADSVPPRGTGPHAPPAGSPPAEGSDGRRALQNRLNRALSDALRMLRAHDLGEVADVALRQAQARVALPRVVVVGETKRGKSSLVNALVGRRDVCPVGEAETSATYVTVRPVTSGGPRAEVLLADGRTVPISDGDVANSAVADRPPEQDQGLPVEVVVHLPTGPLGEVVVTDTPGAGGLGGARARMSRRMVAETGCLVFVVDAGSPMSRPELDYLLDCATSVEQVVVCVTMVDKYPQTSDHIVDGVARRLREHSPRLGRFPVVAVSAEAALAAQELPPGELADALLEASGVPRLARLVRQATTFGVSPSANALRTCRTALAGVMALLDMRVAVQSAGPAVQDDLRARRDDLVALRSSQQRWTLDLDRDLGRVRADIARDLNVRLDTLSQTWRDRIEHTPLTARQSYVRAASQEMASEYQMLREDLAAATRSRLLEVVGALFGPALPPGVTEALGASLPVSGERSDFRPPTMEVADPAMVMSASVGVGLAVKLAGASLLGAAALPVAVASASAWLAFTWAYKSSRLGRSALTMELGRTLAAERTAILDALDSRIREIKPELVVAYRQQLRESLAAMEALVRDAEQAAAASQTERSAAVAELGRQREELRAVLRDADDALAGLHS